MTVGAAQARLLHAATLSVQTIQRMPGMSSTPARLRARDVAAPMPLPAPPCRRAHAAALLERHHR
ncbi:MAG: hypothetical protein M3519_11180, partial [Actinomycetota bacterium]|nr:hypothetical protein [Actinomycetota bacterium]